MEFSSDWRSPWTISSTFSAPSLLHKPSSATFSAPSLLHKPSSATNGPLLFSPSRPHRTLLSSPSLFPRLPPPTYASSSFHHDLKAFFGSCHGDFTPISFQCQLLDSLLPDLHTFPASPHPNDPILPNLLRALPSRDGRNLFLFFPVGTNADHLGYLGLSLDGGVQATGTLLDSKGDVFVQCEGFRHRHHRIIHLSTRAVDDDDETPDKIQGHLLAATLYSVNWFRVESDLPGLGLAPVMKQGFKDRVIHACWNPHFTDESAVLLENGKVVLVDHRSRKGVAFDVSAGGKLGDLLSCDFAGQPWNLIVAGSISVASFDLRSGDSTEPVCLARIDRSDVYKVLHSMADDRFVAFCRAEFDFLFFSVVTKYHLLLFDVRRPEFPLLTWDHGIGGPTHVEMFKLSDLRSFECADACLEGYAILVASPWEDAFKLFCYGPCRSSSSFRAWELPSRISFSGRDGSSTADEALREDFFKGGPPRWVDWQEKKDLVTGFHVCPRSCTNCWRGSEETDGFELIRIMSTGELEVQVYGAQWDRLDEKPGHDGSLLARADVSLFHHWKDVDLQVRNPKIFKLIFLTAYMSGDLPEALLKVLDGGRQINGSKKGVIYDGVLWEIIRSKIPPFTSMSLSDVTFPASLHDIANRRLLATPPSALMYLSFSRYGDLPGATGKYSLEFFEVPSALANGRIPPLLTGKPSRRATRWSKLVKPGGALICPTLPPPIILALEGISSCRAASSQGTQPDEDLLEKQCDVVRRHFFPEISLASAIDFNDRNGSTVHGDESSFFTLDVLGAAAVHGITEVDKQPVSQPEKNAGASGSFENQNFTTFIVGARESHNIKPSEGKDTLDLFDDLGVVKLDYAWPDIQFSADEERVYRSLGKQFLKWQGRYSHYQEFCTSKRISSGIL